MIFRVSAGRAGRTFIILFFGRAVFIPCLEKATMVRGQATAFNLLIGLNGFTASSGGTRQRIKRRAHSFPPAGLKRAHENNHNHKKKHEPFSLCKNTAKTSGQPGTSCRPGYPWLRRLPRLRCFAPALRAAIPIPVAVAIGGARKVRCAAMKR